MPRLAPLALAAAMLMLGSGCPGTLEIWGVNVPIPGSGGGDDDDTADLNFDNFDGTEFLNIKWTPEEIADGHFDCAAEWRSQGPNSTLDDQNLCPECSEIWQVNLVAQPDAEECLNQGTDIDVPGQYTRKVGFALEVGSVSFDVFRTQFSVDSPLGDSENDTLIAAGIGAFNGTEYTWSGTDSPVVNEQLGYSFFFSGEGEF